MNKKNQEKIVQGAIKLSENTLFSEIKNHWIPLAIIAVICILAYSNTLSHDYALDDQMVIYDNKYVTAGTDSLHRIMTRDAFEGFFGTRGSQLISGGRYRPLSFVTFAIEWFLFGRNPMISHTINVLSNAILCAFIYLFLIWLFPIDYTSKRLKSQLISLPFLATIFYALHPLHTEVVANIKGRDEIFGFLFGILALIYFFQVFKSRIFDYILLMIVFLFALLSKENAITFLAIFPLVALVKRLKIFSSEFIRPYLSILCATAIYLGLRMYSTQSSLLAHSEEILNNPFLRANSSEKWGTIFFSYLEYFKLLIFPWKLTHDYYFNQIPYRKMSDPVVMFSLLLLSTLIFWLIKNWRQRNEIVFSLLFFIITFSIVSNLFFTVGIIMNERFVFVSSLGFTIILAWFIQKYVSLFPVKIALIILICGFYSIKTFTRNLAWKDNFTLFSTDYYNSPNSAKVATSFGGDLLSKSNDIVKTDSLLANKYLDSSIKVLEHSISIYPENSQAWLLYGNAIYAKNKNIDEAISIYRNCLQLRSQYFDALYNIGILNFNRKQDDSAGYYLKLALDAQPGNKEVRETLGKIYTKQGKTSEALALLEGYSSSYGDLAMDAIDAGNYSDALALAEKGLAAQPEDPSSNFAKGLCLSKFMNKLPEGIPYLEKAVRLNPENGYWIEDLAVAYGMSGRVKETIPLLEKVIKLRPTEVAGYHNLATTYHLLGDKTKAQFYTDQAKARAKN